jgi:phage shock protein PspC (stress-responsive transcriptional regulator)
MNEVMKIHLGRQAFTISVDAHHILKRYLDAIQEQVDDKEVVGEIELRMAELLLEHGLNSNKVILPSDVAFLKEQLGNPTDFKDDSDEKVSSENKPSDGKRLFRDTDSAILAGVAAGLAKYFGIDVLLVRLLFVVLVFVTFGWGILLYVVLWLLVPEAKTSSDRLLMAGKSVTVNSLKEVVENADVKGAAHRANARLAGPINAFFRLVLKLIGLIIIVSGLSILFGLLTGETYFLSRGSGWQQDNIFPVGLREHLLLDTAVAVAALLAVFITVLGIATFQRKWPIRTWLTGVLVGLMLVGLAIGGALAADVYPGVHGRYNANLHITTRSVPQFTGVNINNSDIGVNFQASDKYFIVLNYYGNPNLTTIKTSVKNGTLVIDTNQFNDHRNCQTLCIPPTYNLSVTIYSPNSTELESQDSSMPIQPPAFIKQP